MLRTFFSRLRWLGCAVLFVSSLLGQSPSIAFIGNAFGSLQTLSPGSLAFMSVGTSISTSINTKITVNSVSCLIVRNGPHDFLFRIPTDTKLGLASVVITNNGLSSTPVNVTISDYSPQIQQVPFGSAYAFHADGTPVANTAPVAPGERVTIYVTGLGAVDPPPRPSFSVGGFQANVEAIVPNALDGSFAGTTGVPGVYALTFTVPPSLPSGTYGLVLSIGGKTSDESPFNAPAQIPVLATGLIPSQTGATFRAVTGSATVQQRTIAVSAPSQVIVWSASASTVSGGNWLQVTPPAATSDPKQPPTLLTISASASNLAPGDYYGTVTIRPIDANSALFISVVLSVLPATQSPGATVEPTGLVFTGSPGGAAPSAQNIQISNPTTAPLTFSITSVFPGATPWFRVQPSPLVIAPGQPLSISVQPNAGLPAGTQVGSLVFAFSDGQMRFVSLQVVIAAGARTTAPFHSRRAHPQRRLACRQNSCPY